jgi:6-pyruvoyltetrahydropterin/6-carboxytetrahydropterin synthase
MRVTKHIGLDAGHRVMRHGGQCCNPHGHRYEIHATCEAGLETDPTSPAYGMVIDFSALKAILNEHIHDVLDHGFIVEDSDVAMREALAIDPTWKVIVVEDTPTAEWMARWTATELNRHLPEGLDIVQVVVFETPTSSATWRAEDQEW